MRYMAHVVPATSTAIARGDIASVVSAAMRLLDSHPRYTVAIRPSDKETKPRHSIWLRATADGLHLEAHPGEVYVARPGEIERDMAEIHMVLFNLGCTIINQETST